MQLKLKEFLALGSFLGWFINYMKFKKVWAKWLFGLVCLGSIIFIIFSRESDSNGVSQTATTSGSNSPINQIGSGNSNVQSQVTVNGGNVQLGNGNTQLINQPPDPSIDSTELVSQFETNGEWITVIKFMAINIRDKGYKLHYESPYGTRTEGKIVMAATSIIAGTGNIVPFQKGYLTNFASRKIDKDEIRLSIVPAPK